MEIIIALSALIANGLTQIMKRPKEAFSETDLATRKTVLRIINALIGVVTLLVASAITGQNLNIVELQGFIETIILGVVTYFTSQGMFFTAKSSINKPTLQD